MIILNLRNEFLNTDLGYQFALRLRNFGLAFNSAMSLARALFMTGFGGARIGGGGGGGGTGAVAERL
jgi:hypothetical protein